MNQSPSILITGGTGLLGKAVCHFLDQAGLSYQVASHQKPTLNGSVFMDLTTSNGMAEAVRGKNVILHLASDKKHPDNDVHGTERLLDAIRSQGLNVHFIYISIVGVEELPMPYFKQKAQVEKMVMQSGIPYSILKATQFHEYVDSILHSLFKLGIGLVPKNVFVQPVSVTVIAKKLVDICMSQPTFRMQSLGGPEIFKLEDLAGQWLQARMKSNKHITFSLWGNNGKKLKNGVLTCPQDKAGGLNWRSWLKEHYRTQRPKEVAL